MYVDTFVTFNMKQVTSVVLVIAMVAGIRAWECVQIDCGTLFGYKVVLPETSIPPGTDVVIDVPDVCDGAKPNGLSALVCIEDEDPTLDCHSTTSIAVHRNGDANAEGTADITVYCPTHKRRAALRARLTPPTRHWPII